MTSAPESWRNDISECPWGWGAGRDRVKHWPSLLAFWAFPAASGPGRDLRPWGHPARPPKLQNGTLRTELKRHCPQRPSQPHLLANFLPSPYLQPPRSSSCLPQSPSRLPALKYGKSWVKHAQNLLGNRMHLHLWTKNRLSPALPKAASSAGLSPQVASSESPP